MVTIKLPMDVAWEKAVFHTLQDEVGVVIVTLNLGENGNYALLAKNDDSGESTIYAGVEVDTNLMAPLTEPAAHINLGIKRYVGIPVQNAHQAGAVIHIMEDAMKQSMPVVDAVNYIAERIR